VRRSNNFVVTGVVIPLKGVLVARLDREGFRYGYVIDIACHGRRSKIFDGVIGWWGTNVLISTIASTSIINRYPSSLGWDYLLKNAIDPRSVHSGMGIYPRKEGNDRGGYSHR